MTSLLFFLEKAVAWVFDGDDVDPEYPLHILQELVGEDGVLGVGVEVQDHFCGAREIGLVEAGNVVTHRIPIVLSKEAIKFHFAF